MHFPLRLRHAAIFLTGFLLCGLWPSTAVELTPAQHQQIAKFLPRTTPRMLKRDPDNPIRVVVLGDSVSNYYQPETEQRYDLDRAWHSVFLRLVADHFFLTGGLRQVGPVRRAAGQMPEPKADPDAPPGEAEALDARAAGMAIEVETLARDGATVLQAFQELTTEAFDLDPDLVLMMYGTNDAFSGLSLRTYRQTLEAAAALCKARGVDLILLGPPLICGGDDRATLGLTRPYASIVREVAEKAGVLSVDAGAAQAATEVGVDGPSVEECFAKVRRHVRRQYDHSGTEDFFHPNALGHQIIGKSVWRALYAEPSVGALSASGSFTLPAAADAPGILEITLRNNTAQDIESAALSALGFDRVWLPQTALSAGGEQSKLSAADVAGRIHKGRTFRIPCVATKPSQPNPGSRVDLPVGEEDFLSASVLVSEGQFTRLVDLRVPLLPVSVSFPTGRIESSGNEVALDLVATNAEAGPFEGTAELDWRGHTESFPVRLEPGKRTPFRMKLPLPADPALRHFKSLVTLRLKRQGAAYTFVRELEFAHHLGLGQTVELSNRSRMVADAPAGPAEPGAAPNATVKADPTGLYFVFDLPPAVAAAGTATHAAEIEITIDARPPGQRGTVGFCDHIQLAVPWEDGRFPVRKVRPALFGNGYDRDLDERFFLASLTTQRDSRRQVRLSIPRNYFYLHQWSLGAEGQNTLGLNTIVSLIEFSEAAPAGTFPFQKSYSLVCPGMTRNDPLALGVLELQTKPPAGWSVRVY